MVSRCYVWIGGVAGYTDQNPSHCWTNLFHVENQPHSCQHLTAMDRYLEQVGVMDWGNVVSRVDWVYSVGFGNAASVLLESCRVGAPDRADIEVGQVVEWGLVDRADVIALQPL